LLRSPGRFELPTSLVDRPTCAGPRDMPQGWHIRKRELAPRGVVVQGNRQRDLQGFVGRRFFFGELVTEAGSASAAPQSQKTFGRDAEFKRRDRASDGGGGEKRKRVISYSRKKAAPSAYHGERAPRACVAFACRIPKPVHQSVDFSFSRPPPPPPSRRLRVWGFNTRPAAGTEPTGTMNSK